MSDITSLQKTGNPGARVDLTIVAEGYTAAERDKFLTDAATFSDYMFGASQSKLNAPFSTFKNYFNINALFVASNQSRWDVVSGTADTYFQAASYLSDGRLVYGDTGKVFQTVNAALPANEHDITIVLINSKVYGGAGGSVAWATTGSTASAEVLLHELGHSVANLGDEYVDSALGSEPLTYLLQLPNVTSSKSEVPWQAWLGYKDELGTVGLYEGGYYRSTGVWRATEQSKMLSLGQPFNAPEKEALALAFYSKTGDYLAIDTTIPGMGYANVPNRAMLSYAWSQDGATLGNGASYLYDIYGAGKYTAGAILKLTTQDATGLIRTGLSKTTQTESVAVTGSALDMTGAASEITQGGNLFRFDAGDNLITVRSGVSGAYIDGGNGADTVVLANMSSAGVTLEQLASGTWLLSNAASPLLAFRNVETIQFSDKSQALVQSVTGTAGNDRLASQSASEVINGGAGTDTLAYQGARAGFTIAKSGTGFTVTDNASGAADIVTNIERLSFSDASIALDTAGVGGQAYRLYQAAFARTPDLAGLGYWISVMDKGATLREVAAGFTQGDEFKSVYGANPTNAQIIDKLYQNVLHRAGEADGVAYWRDILDNHKDTLANVLANFSEGAENQAGVATVIGNGFAYTPYG